jgi:hypothetical protein
MSSNINKQYLCLQISRHCFLTGKEQIGGDPSLRCVVVTREPVMRQVAERMGLKPLVIVTLMSDEGISCTQFMRYGSDMETGMFLANVWRAFPGLDVPGTLSVVSAISEGTPSLQAALSNANIAMEAASMNDTFPPELPNTNKYKNQSIFHRSPLDNSSTPIGTPDALHQYNRAIWERMAREAIAVSPHLVREKSFAPETLSEISKVTTQPHPAWEALARPGRLPVGLEIMARRPFAVLVESREVPSDFTDIVTVFTNRYLDLAMCIPFSKMDTRIPGEPVEDLDSIHPLDFERLDYSRFDFWSMIDALRIKGSVRVGEFSLEEHGFYVLATDQLTRVSAMCCAALGETLLFEIVPEGGIADSRYRFVMMKTGQRRHIIRIPFSVRDEMLGYLRGWAGTFKVDPLIYQAAVKASTTSTTVAEYWAECDEFEAEQLDKIKAFEEAILSWDYEQD